MRSTSFTVRHLTGLCKRVPGALARRLVRATLALPGTRRAYRSLTARFPGVFRSLRHRLYGAVIMVPPPVSAVPAPSNPANVVGPRFHTLLMDDLAQQDRH